MVSLSNTCTVYFICQCFNLWSFLWLWLNAILLFISDKNFSALSLEFLDFRVLIMNILCLFQCPCLTRTALAFKSPLSVLSGKWCSHAMGLFCLFSIFSSRAEIKYMQSLWQISVLQHNFGFLMMSSASHRIIRPKGNKKCPLQCVTQVALARQTQQQQQVLVHLFFFFWGLSERAVPFLQLQGISQQVSHKPWVSAKRVCFLESAFSSWEEEISIVSSRYKWTDWESLGGGLYPSHPVQCGPEKYTVTN